MNPTILVPKIKDKEDSFFYRLQEDIAEMKAKDGTKFFVFASGDVDVEINGVDYNDEHRFKAGKFGDLTDKDLSQDLDWKQNNWFELGAVKPNDKRYYDGAEFCGEVAYDYDEAIQLLKDTVEQYNKGEIEL